MEAFIGTILPWPMNWAPQGWALCNGQLLSIQQYSAVFALLGTTYGGDGRNTFGLPDLRSRVPVGGGMGAGNGLPSVNLGEMSGTPTVTLNEKNLPAHTHAVTVTINTGSDTNLTNVATGRALSSDARGGGVPPMMYTDSPKTTTLRADSATAVVSPAGSNAPISVMQPYTGMGYIICLYGIFPSRP